MIARRDCRARKLSILSRGRRNRRDIPIAGHSCRKSRIGIVYIPSVLFRLDATQRDIRPDEASRRRDIDGGRDRARTWRFLASLDSIPRDKEGRRTFPDVVRNVRQRKVGIPTRRQSLKKSPFRTIGRFPSHSSTNRSDKQDLEIG